GAVFVEDISEAARHAGREIAPRLAEHDHDAAGHIFAAMVAGALDDGDGAGIPDGKALAGDAAEIALAFDGAVENRVADDDRFLRDDSGLARRINDDVPARETLADIVVAFALELERDAAREPGAEALARRALELHMHRVVGQA